MNEEHNNRNFAIGLLLLLAFIALLMAVGDYAIHQLCQGACR